MKLCWQLDSGSPSHALQGQEGEETEMVVPALGNALELVVEIHVGMTAAIPLEKGQEVAPLPGQSAAEMCMNPNHLHRGCNQTKHSQVISRWERIEH